MTTPFRDYAPRGQQNELSRQLNRHRVRPTCLIDSRLERQQQTSPPILSGPFRIKFPFYASNSGSSAFSPALPQLFLPQPHTMRIFSLVPVLAALATAVAGVPLPRDVGNIQMFAKRDFSDQRVSRNVGGLTNAELLRRGLPPKGPVMRRGASP